MQHNRHHMQKNGYASFSYTQPFEKRAEPGKYLPEASDRYRAIRQRRQFDRYHEWNKYTGETACGWTRTATCS